MTSRYTAEPVLHPVELAHLRPTQMTVGKAEVERKRHEWRNSDPAEGGDWLGRHMIPAVIGPKGTPWIIDHHHLALALQLEGVEHVLVSIVARLDHLPRGRFLSFMDNRNWLHPYDAEGHRRDFDDLPRRLGGLKDDPYRSLAGELRRQGGYAKTETPYSEFLWADFLRQRIGQKLIAHDLDRAIAKGLRHARSPAAAYLPGFAGPSDG
ncbi:MAG: chromosome partitioning protein ParB [Sphingomonadales bacterium]|nr:chromosome partitioning protein ParB [Sphingomonadales bacterium]